MLVDCKGLQVDQCALSISIVAVDNGMEIQVVAYIDIVKLVCCTCTPKQTFFFCSTS